MRVLFSLLQKQRNNIPIAQRLIRLIGVVSLGGIAIHDLKSMLQLLRKPSELSLSVLQCLKTAVRSDDVERKASPSAFFNLGGQGAGLFLPAEGDWPFQREYQVHFWFRLEGTAPRTEDPAEAMHLFTCVSATGNGVDVTLTGGKLRVKIADGDETKVFVPNMSDLHPGVWYHFHILHTKPKLILFGREEVFVHIDHKLVLSKPVRMPLASKVGEIVDWSVGRNFNGQIGTIWIMHEAMPDTTVEGLASHDAHRGVDTTKVLGGVAPPDVNPSAVGEKRSFAHKALAVFHASRCAQHHALDIHGGLHARFGRYTQAWTLVGAREVISSIGGISAILPIFPRLLWENQESRRIVAQKSITRFATLAAKEPARVEKYNLPLGLGNPLAALFEDTTHLQFLHPSTLSILMQERDEYKENTPISILLSIISRCFRNHPSNQAELLQSGGIDMLEYVLYCLPDEFMQAERMPAVMAVMRLRGAANGNEQLENVITRRIFANFKIWSRTTPQLQRDLMAIVVTTVRADPHKFLKVLDVQTLLDTMLEFFMHDEAAALAETLEEPDTEETPVPPLLLNRHSTADTVLSDRRDQSSTDDGSNYTPSGRRRSMLLTRRMNSKRRSISAAPTPFSDADDDESQLPAIDLGFSPAAEGDMENVGPESVFAVCQERKLSDPPDMMPFATDHARMQLLRESDGYADSDDKGGGLSFRSSSYGMPIDDDGDDIMPYSQLTQSDRKYLRGCILSMMMALIKCHPSEETVRPLVYTMCDCTDEVVLNEVAQLLLSVLTTPQSESGVVAVLTSLLGSQLGVIAFILHRLVQRPSEQLRCTGIRLLTHYSCRVAGLSSFRKGPLRQLARQGRPEGIDWLGQCGALQLLAQYLLMFKDMCTEKTYAALLEMLLTKPGPMNHQPIEEGMSAEDMTASTEFSVADLNPHTIMDENQDMTNPAVLSVFFEILGMLPMSVQEKVYGDLLLLLKHSKRNCEAFSSHQQWQLCLFGLVAQLMVVNDHDASVTIRTLVLAEDRSDGESFSPMASPVESSSDGRLTGWFDIGMKIFGLLVVHQLKEGNGKAGELRKTLSFSLQDIVGRAVSLAVLSHVLSEYRLPVSMILADAIRYSSTPTQPEFIQARNKLLTVLTVVMDAGFAVISEPVASRRIVGLELGRTRLSLVDDAIEEYANKRCTYQCDEASHEICMLSMDNCAECGHAWAVHPATPSAMELVEAKLSQEQGLPSPGGLHRQRSARLEEPQWLLGGGQENVLDPLHRGFNLQTGRLLVTMQLLHLFDMIFLPIADQPMKNAKLLEHPAESLKCNVFFAAMRMTLFVMQELCPTHERAILNVRRLRRLMVEMQQFSVELSVTRQDWVLLILTHTLELLRKLHGVVVGRTPGEDDAISALHARILTTANHRWATPIAARIIDIVLRLSGVTNELMDLLGELVNDHPETISDAIGRKPFSNLSVLVTERKYADPLPTVEIDQAMSPVEQLPLVEPHLRQMSQWLSSPALRIDMMKSESAIRAIDLVEEQEKMLLAALNSQLADIAASTTKHRPSHANFDTDEMEQLQSLATEVIQKVSTQEINRDAALATMFETQMRVAASYWQKCLRQMSAEWSPWADETISTKWKLSKHTDSKSRRMLLVHNFDFQSHEDAAYQDRGEKFQQLPKLDQSLGDLKVQDITKEDSTSGLDDSDTSVGESKTGTTSFLKSSKDTVLQNTKRRDVDLLDDDDEIDDEQTRSRTQHWTTAFEWFPDERWVGEMEASQITAGQTILGTLVVSNRHVYFHPRKRQNATLSTTKPLKDRRWRLDRLSEMYARRYLLQNCALELFFADSAGVFFAFRSIKARHAIYRAIKRQHTPLMRDLPSLNPKVIFQQSPWTEMWRKRQITNFEYLMRLNTLAGRSFNDITQYPVFPWVLADYTSETIDLRNPAVYRDLSKPVGALNPERLEEFLERYREFDDPHVPKFMYGSHYSSAGVVLHYMLRQEPFTSLAIALQGGRFDCPDRLFFDLASSWESCNRSMSDVKELIPEMFCCPEILLNTNNFPLGTLQDDRGVVDDVRLPPWAKDAYDFIRIHREALESDYVSENLHHWIDLIFGYKQRGEAAVEANNVFYYLTYEGAVDIDKIEDPVQREATKAQVTHFGQTPAQLLARPHPIRMPQSDCTIPICTPDSDFTNLQAYYPDKSVYQESPAELASHGPVLDIRCVMDRLVIVHADLSIRSLRWIAFPDADGRPFQLRPDKTRQLASASLSVSHHVIRKLSRFAGFVPTDVPSTRPFQPLAQEPLSPSQMAAMGDFQPRAPSARLSKRVSDSNIPAGPSPFSTISKGFKSFFSRPHSQSSPSIVVSGATRSSETEEKKSEATPSSGAQQNGTAASGAGGPDLTVQMPNQDLFTHKSSSILHSQRRSRRQELSTDSGYFAGAHATGVGPWSVGVAIGEDLTRSKVITCGYWDQSVKCHQVESGKELDSVDGVHVSNIRCLDYGSDPHILITGGQDGTCRVWIVDHPAMAAALAAVSPNSAGAEALEKGNMMQCVHTLYGHDSSITAIHHSRDLDLVLSGSENGLLCLHTVRKGKFVRSISDMLGNCVDLVLLTTTGYLVAHSWHNDVLYVFSLNGQKLAEAGLTQRLCCVITNGPGNVLLCGGENGTLSFRALPGLQPLHEMDLSQNGSIRSLWFGDDDQYVFVGFENGNFVVCTDRTVRLKMIQATIQNTPLLGTPI